MHERCDSCNKETAHQALIADTREMQFAKMFLCEDCFLERTQAITRKMQAGSISSEVIRASAKRILEQRDK
jgi:hypothetical protein